MTSVTGPTVARRPENVGVFRNRTPLSWLSGHGGVVDTALEIARQYVREAEARVSHQREVLVRLSPEAHPRAYRDAAALLETFESALASYRHHLMLELQLTATRSGRPLH